MQSKTSGHHEIRLPSLDGLRCIAVLLVILSHSWSLLLENGHGQVTSVNASLFIRAWGRLGVGLFFALSGFLITHLLCREQQTTGQISMRNFYVRRGLRILPPFVLYVLTIVALTYLAVLEIAPERLWIAGCFLQNYFPGEATGDQVFLGHLWTLAAEEQFYLLWPAAFFFLGPKRLRTVGLVLVLMAPLLRVVHYFALPDLRTQLTAHFHGMYDRFLWGCLAAVWHDRIRELLKRTCAGSPYMFCTAVAYYFVGTPILELKLGGAFNSVIGIPLMAICATYIVFWSCEMHQLWPGKLLNWSPLRTIGLMSYSIYLWQGLFTFGGKNWASPNVPVLLLGTFGGGALSYFLAELPMARLRSRFRGKGRVAGPKVPGPYVASTPSRVHCDETNPSPHRSYSDERPGAEAANSASFSK